MKPSYVICAYCHWVAGPHPATDDEATIERLKAEWKLKGCRRCGNHRFIRRVWYKV